MGLPVQTALPQPEQLTPLAFLQEVKTTLDAAGVAYTDIVLFGSRARGTHHEWSDYDVLIVVPGEANRELRLYIIDLLNNRFAPKWVGVEPLIVGAQEYVEWGEMELPIWTEIAREGVKA